MARNDLHSKYRPASFDAVVGQDRVVKSVEQALEKNLSHSFIFTGPSGVGKTTLARLIAKAVKCDEQNLKEVDAATCSGVDVMRSIIETSQYIPMSASGVRVLIIDEAHALSKAAWQSLLKCVEEPPEHLYWVFCTTEPSKIPNTICTRCLKYELAPVKSEVIYDLLLEVAKAEDYGTGKAVLYAVAEHADGSPRRALTMLAQCCDCKTRKEALLVLRSVEGTDTQVVELCQAIYKGVNWERAMHLIEDLGDVSPESLRIVITQYFIKVATGAKSNDVAGRACEVLDAFSTPCNASDGMAPVLVGLARVILRT